MRNTALPALTGVRFYAALLVFLTHVPHLAGMEWLWDKHDVIFHLGDLGVALFFVLSGFILTYNYSSTFSDDLSASSYGRFIWNRFTKIYPVHLLTLLIALPIQILSPNHPLNWWALPVHVSLTQSFMPFDEPKYYLYLNAPSWSICCEWFFYMLAPFAISLTATRRRRLVGIVAALAYAAVVLAILSRISSDENRLYFYGFFAPTRFIDFLCGIFLATLFSKFADHGPGHCTTFEVLGIALLAVGAVYKPAAPSFCTGGILYLPGAALLIYGLAVGRGLLARHLGSPLLLTLGGASFALYMIHMPIIRIGKAVLLLLHREIASWPVIVAAIFVMFVAAQAAALFIFKYYETPMQTFLRAIPSRSARVRPCVEDGNEPAIR